MERDHSPSHAGGTIEPAGRSWRGGEVVENLQANRLQGLELLFLDPHPIQVRRYMDTTREPRTPRATVVPETEQLQSFEIVRQFVSTWLGSHAKTRS